jgi:hypothetical protein
VVIAALAAVVLTTSGAPAFEETPRVTPGVRQMASLGMEWRDGAGPREGTHREPFTYPNVRYAVSTTHFYGEASSALPVLLPDLIGAVFVFLGGGDGIPLWFALNGDNEPAAFRVMEARARYVHPLLDAVALEAGAAGGFHVGAVFVGDQRISILPVSAGASLAVRTGTDGFASRVAVEGGNETTRFSSQNPWYGVAASSTLAFGGPIAFEIRGEWRRERLDLREYRTVEGDAIADVDWWTVYGVEAALAYRF